MNFLKNSAVFFSILFVFGCATYEVEKKREKKFYSSIGFALIYDDDLRSKGIVNKKLDNNKINILHNFLKPNTPIKIINPNNSIVIETKVSKKGNYPKIFNVVISKKLSDILELDPDNPYVEIIEFKKNRTFIAKKAKIFDEEKKVALNVPLNEIKMDDLSENLSENKIKVKKSSYILVISDFYYFESAENLRLELIKKTTDKNFLVKKIKENQYRLYIGPFKNFNALKSIYISLNNLGFGDLNIYKE